MLGAFSARFGARGLVKWLAGSPVLFLSESHQIDLAQKTHSKSSRDVECGQVLLLASSYFEFIFNEPYLHLRHGLDFTALEHEF